MSVGSFKLRKVVEIQGLQGHSENVLIGRGTLYTCRKFLQYPHYGRAAG